MNTHGEVATFETDQASCDGRERLIRAAVEKAHPNALRVALYQATADPALAAMPAERKPFWGGTYYQVMLADGDVEVLRRKALDYLLSNPAATNELPSDVVLRRYMEIFNGGVVDDFTFAMGKEELSFEDFPRGVDWESEPSQNAKAAFHVIIIGAGAAGLAAAVQLDRLGVPYTVVERNAGVGGTWWTNDYPDSRVDIVSHNYQLSFMRNYPWQHYFATQPELKAYFQMIAETYDLLDRIRFNTELVEAQWDEETASWHTRLRHADGTEQTLVGQVLISAAGLFNQPNLPDIAGIESFKGRIFHTTAWDHSYNPAGKRVGLIGVGSTGAQLVPALARSAAALSVFQRSPQWVGKRDGYRDRVDAEVQWLFDNMPYYWNWYCFALFHTMFDIEGLQTYDRAWQAAGGFVSERNDLLRENLKEYVGAKVGHRPDLARHLIPDFPPLAKRLIADNGWYDALLRPNVELVTEGIERITPSGILTRDGCHRDFDLIVLCAGFRTNAYLWPVRYEGRNDQTLEQAWEKDGARAYLGMTVPNFPNLFIVYGPNAQARAGGLMAWLEIWVRYAVKSIAMMIENGVRSMDCRPEIYEDYNKRLDHTLEECIWGGAKSYYVNEHGRQNTNMPWHPRDYYNWVRKPNFDDYRLR